MQETCIFCAIPSSAWLIQNEHYYVIYDQRPVSKGHCLIISKRHVVDYFELNEEEAAALQKISTEVKSFLAKEYAPSGYNLAMNCGSRAGQTVFHYHMHVIPRY
jgi:diadenosine tetraphosphate (Ap4A) HIT family hydrolase